MTTMIQFLREDQKNAGIAAALRCLEMLEEEEGGAVQCNK